MKSYIDYNTSITIVPFKITKYFHVFYPEIQLDFYIVNRTLHYFREVEICLSSYFFSIKSSTFALNIYFTFQYTKSSF